MRLKNFLILSIFLYLLNSCEFRIKETEYDNGPGKAQEETNTEMSNPDVTKDFLVGKFDYHKDERFVLVDKKWCDKEIYLQKKTYQAFVKMAEAAKEDDIELTVVSGTRSFNDQKIIWEKKWKNNQKKIKNAKDNALKILLYSSMPATSRHHWGTDLDINSVEESYFNSIKGKKVYRWLVENANKYGFCQVYSDKKRSKRTGYNTEVWHWSYMPLSNYYLDNYVKNISYSDINGFLGSEAAKEITMIQKYVQGIDRACSSLSTVQPEEK
jgi:LAS superfamily LD-carboxypeptidase LdcB